ncbi:mediator of RNA polymerase II transcription subunit 4 [Plectosphaerella plurivora]|uniref:Mediator of RNA polymerase II transcription subunit 4 n=1 Tax=Plectosphaerella plurivora TaxID=936078 RepID=A0A9P8V417_9PEZI|nr:mediator of RNA polymerase II transcription subunit 4 [Plectosphaerella plurivora]
MDTFIDARFERVEKALASLIDSVAKYHPYAKQATDLKEADRQLAEGLLTVEKHQNNHLRLQQLRATSSALDTQIRETLTTLASTRRDITTTHITGQPDGKNYPIKYNELLNYARRISKTTLPPAGVTNGLPETEALPETTAATGAAAPVNGVQSGGTSAAPTPTPTQTQTQTPDASGLNGISQPSEFAPTQQTMATTATAETHTSLPEGLRTVLNPYHGASFVPWPDEFAIRSGALAAIQDLEERGIDPKGYDPSAIAEEARRKEEEDRAAREEAERIKKERDQKRREEWEAGAAARQAAEKARREAEAASGTVASASAGKAKQFQFASMDMDDDDDED